MNTTVPASDKQDKIKWWIIAGLLTVGMAGFYYFDEHSLLLRVVTLLVLVSICVFIALKTEKGHFAWDFMRESQLEVRKVVWPTRQETLQMTGIVIVMVVVVALLIWLLDSVLFWAMRLLTGHGG